MNGVGTKAVNALSEFFEVRSFREGEFSEAYFEEGRLKSKKRGKLKTNEHSGTYIRYKPDLKVLKKFKVREEHVLRRMKMYCYVNAGLTIVLNGQEICSDRGLADLIADEAQFEKLYQPFHVKTKSLEIIFTHTNRFGEEYHTFVNGQYTTDGGTHLTAFKEALTKALNDYDPKKKFDGDDIRDGLLGAVSVRIMNPVFEGQTKIKFVMNDIKSELVQQMKKEIEAALHRSPSEAEKLISKVEETGKIRSQLNTIKKQARERSQAVSVRVPQLKDCKNHLKLDKVDKKTGKAEGEDTMIFLTEGQSAGGTLGGARDAMNQAVFFLRGKCLNTCGLNKDVLYKNEEFFNLIKTLDIEDTLEHLRYGKIIFATDADAPHDVLHALLPPAHPRRARLHPRNAPLPRQEQEGALLLLHRRGARGRDKEVRARLRDHALQGTWRDRQGGLQGLHRRGDAPYARDLLRRHRCREDDQVLHGRQHARAQGLHHGVPRLRRRRVLTDTTLAALPRRGCFGLGLASFAADTRQSSGEKAGGDIDFAVFHILPVPSSLSAK